ncbi:mitochondrial carrier domain-containing protein [Pelagophyceae sp. CCMP2097]|nr:mitochondrial carrier domain-containing protein [Pelagophyceae sp. CCMP2097]
MAGAHSGLGDALKSIGVRGLYPMKTWNAALVAKVPAYSLNWVVYQHLRRWRAKNKPEHLRGEHASPVEDVIIGAIASSLSVCIMIPFDTIKVRMTTNNIGFIPYTGVGNALRRMLAEEGLICFYRGLPPRLLSVVPMTAIQFAIYEVCKRRIPDVEQSLRNMLSQKSLQPALTGFEASEAAR